MDPENPPPERPVVTTTEARQGTTRVPVRYVLAASLFLAVLAMLIAFLFA